MHLTRLKGEDLATDSNLNSFFLSSFRPSAAQVKGHCFFWNEESQISFINDVMATLDGCSAKEKDAIINHIMAEIMAEIKLSQKNVTNWYDIMDEEVRKDLLGKCTAYANSKHRLVY